jgi:hypothetical protein
MKLRNGRMFFMHCESAEACEKWLLAIRSVGANIVDCAPTTLDLKKASLQPSNPSEGSGADMKGKLEELRANLRDAAIVDEPAPAPVVEESTGPKRVHKVIGGIVIATEKK